MAPWRASHPSPTATSDGEGDDTARVAVVVAPRRIVVVAARASRGGVKKTPRAAEAVTAPR